MRVTSGALSHQGGLADGVARIRQASPLEAAHEDALSPSPEVKALTSGPIPTMRSPSSMQRWREEASIMSLMGSFSLA